MCPSTSRLFVVLCAWAVKSRFETTKGEYFSTANFEVIQVTTGMFSSDTFVYWNVAALHISVW